MTDSQPPDMEDREDPRPAHGGPFVPDDFVVPAPPRADALWLERLGPQHNDADFAAWTSSTAHIHATVGFENSRWPHPMTLDDNLGDLVMHADHFQRRLGFTYTVRSAKDDDVIGCVYVYPSDDPAVDATVRSWVRESHAELDAVLAAVVGEWLADAWPFTTIRYR